MTDKKCSACSWRSKRKRKYKEQGNACHSEWGCGRSFAIGRLQLAHLVTLGMGANRQNAKDARNDMTNLVLLCPPCHKAQEATVRLYKTLWRKNLVEYLEPTCDNAEAFLGQIQAGLAAQRTHDKESGENKD